jgi:hypothetical protein
MLAIIDSEGAYGAVFNYSLTLFFFGGAICAFIFFWKKGNLGMDEEAKFQMMEIEEESQEISDG